MRRFHRRALAVVALFGLTAAVTIVGARSAAHDGAAGSAPVAVSADTPPLTHSGPDSLRKPRPSATVARRGHLPKRTTLTHPRTLHLKAAHSKVFDVRKLKSRVVKRERPEVGARDQEEGEAGRATSAAATLPKVLHPNELTPPSRDAPAPPPSLSFDGLDFATWGAGHPPDTNGDVGPTYYIQTVNTSIGIYDKSSGTRVAAFTFNSFMSQGSFGNLCDTDNFGDPVVLYDSFEDRWFLTDFAFKLDGSGNVSPQHVFQCFAVSKTGNPVTGGWNFYSIESPGGLDDYPKFGVWPDGIYMSANMFGYGATAGYISPHVWALNKTQMYANEPSVQVVDFPGPAADFTLLPANARLQAGTPPAGTPEYFASTEEFLNALTVYKLHVDWDKISTSTFTGPDIPINATSWPNASVPNAPTPGNSLDTLQIRAMAQAQYSNIGGAESLWVDHTVRRANTSGSAAPRWYQLNVTGGTVAANTLQGTTWDPDAADTFYRFMPSLAVDRVGDLAIGYSKSNATTNPQIKFAGRLAGDPVNTFSQTEQTLIDGTGTQTGNCGGSTCTRWGDYSGMSLDPDGCTFWQTSEYYAVNGLNDLTRIGSFSFPGCTPVGNGTLSGTVGDGASPIAGATVALGSRTATTDASGHYSFTVPAGSYPALSASKDGFDAASVATISVPNGGTATRNFTLTAAAQSGCFADNTQTAFQRGVPGNCDLVSSPGSVILANSTDVDQQNVTVTNSGFGFNSTSWAGQTFTQGVTGRATKVDVDLFCSNCTGTTPDITVSLRATSGGLPTGVDLATATIPGFSSAAGGLFSANFSPPAILTAGTRYAIVLRAVSNPSAGTYAYVLSSGNPYAGGSRVTSTTSGSTWTADTVSGGRDLGFKVWVNNGFAFSGTLVSSVKDANPAAGRNPTWTTLSWNATTPAGTALKFQVGASNNAAGPFAFVGPDGTPSTFFTTSGASLSQFNGFRYLRYKAFLSTTDTSVTPSISSVTACFEDVGSPTATTLSVDPATGTYGGTTNLSATLTASGGVSGKSVAFTLNGSSVGSATTNASGVASLSSVSLSGIDAGSYPAAVAASFAGDGAYGSSGGSSSLTVTKADQTIDFPAITDFGWNGGSATLGATSSSGLAVSYSVLSGACSLTGNTLTASHAGTCQVAADQAGNGNYNAATQATRTATVSKADQAINVTLHAPAHAAFGATFSVSAIGGGSGNPVTFSSGGACSNSGATFTITSGTGTCTVKYDQAGDSNYNAAPQLTESVDAPPPPPAPNCVVPNVFHKKLAKAEASIKKHHCRVGKISRKHSSLANKGRVLKQIPKASTKKRPNGFAVRLTIGR